MPKPTRMPDEEQYEADELRRIYGSGMLTRLQIGREIGRGRTATGDWVGMFPKSSLTAFRCIESATSLGRSSRIMSNRERRAKAGRRIAGRKAHT